MVGPVLLLVCGASADAMPQRKLGLWEIRTEGRADGQAISFIANAFDDADAILVEAGILNNWLVGL